MIPIIKGLTPKGLEELRKYAANKNMKPKKVYKLLKPPLKDKVRQCLVTEQGGLCAYCMCPIPREDIHPDMEEKAIIIEHFIPRDPVDGRDVGQGLDYNNLLVVCHGNQAPHGTHKKKDLTCDAHRKNIEFKKVNPCDPGTLESIYYHMDGKIDASDLDAKYDLTITLNLNCANVPQLGERKAVLDTLIDEINELKEDEILYYCTKMLNAFQNETNPKTPYVGILIWYLRTTIDAIQTG